MNHNHFEVFFIRSLPLEYLQRTLVSFFETIPPQTKDFDFTVVEERSQREETLNHILSLRSKEKDVLIIADDIIFRPGWYESLSKHYDSSDIFGFAMLFPNTTLIQDLGYDFIQVDGDLTYRGLYKNCELKNIQVPSIRQCDSICGCAMYIKKEVLEKVTSFSLDGNNRVGEIIFTQAAFEKGFNTHVLGSFLYHGGISTKQKKDPKLSSISWLYEKEKWRQNVNKHFQNVIPKEIITQKLSDSFVAKLSMAGKILIYGCGTVADFIIRQNIISDFDICSGLVEEIDNVFHEKIILDVTRLDLLDYDLILITPIGYEKAIIESHFTKKMPILINKILQITKVENKKTIILDIKNKEIN